MMIDPIEFTRETIYEWLYSEKTKPDPIPEPELFKCPKSDKCIMDCYHKQPHAYEEKYCNGKDCPKCVHVLVSDVTFFEEDFNV